jgi:hypothetical protein
MSLRNGAGAAHRFEADARKSIAQAGEREFLLAELKCVSLRSRLVTAVIDSIGPALRGNFISTDDAIAWLEESGGLQFLASRQELGIPDGILGTTK